MVMMVMIIVLLVLGSGPCSGAARRFSGGSLLSKRLRKGQLRKVSKVHTKGTRRQDFFWQIA
jgi:hypothetical protein